MKPALAILAAVLLLALCVAILAGCAGNSAPAASSTQARQQLQAYWKTMGPTMSGLVRDLDALQAEFAMIESGSGPPRQLRSTVREAALEAVPAVRLWARKAASVHPPARLAASHTRFVQTLDASLTAMRRRLAANKPVAPELATVWAAGRLWQTAVERYAATLGVPLPVQTSMPMLVPTAP
jgi:cytochrome c556